MRIMRIRIFTYAIENKFSYHITPDKLTVVDRVTQDEWNYGYVGLLSKKIKERLVYNKMKEMLQNRHTNDPLC